MAGLCGTGRNVSAALQPGDPRIEFMPLEGILRAPRNPKGHALDRLGASFDRFGFVAPPLLDEHTGRLVAGHGRIDALLERRRSGAPPPARVRVADDGGWLVPVIRGLGFASPEDAELYLLGDNKLCELGGWNDEELGKLLADLPPGDAGLAGFSDEELARLVRGLEGDGAENVGEDDD